MSRTHYRHAVVGRTCLIVIGVGILAAGCQAPAVRDPAGPANVYSSWRGLWRVQRVAVLPATGDSANSDQPFGQTSLQPVLLTELAKRARFELVLIAPADLASLTGQATWDAADGLPPDLFAKLRSATGCDAVLFSRLTCYRPYVPLAIGWNLQLVDCRDRSVLWAADELYDAGVAVVAHAARQYEASRTVPPAGRDCTAVLLAPRRFGGYVANAIFEGLPPY